MVVCVTTMVWTRGICGRREYFQQPGAATRHASHWRDGMETLQIRDAKASLASHLLAIPQPLSQIERDPTGLREIIL